MPTNALCNQRVADLQQLLKPLNREVGRAFGGLHSDVLNADTGACLGVSCPRDHLAFCRRPDVLASYCRRLLGVVLIVAVFYTQASCRALLLNVAVVADYCLLAFAAGCFCWVFLLVLLQVWWLRPLSVPTC